MRFTIDERAFTLPLVILLVVLLSVGAALGFSRNSGELHTYSDQQAQVKAAAIAQAGFARYLAGMTAIPASGNQDTTITGIPGGSAFIQLRRVRDSAGALGDIYVVTSHGTASTSGRLGAVTPVAEQTFSQLVAAPTYIYSMNVLSAFTSLNGVTHSGVAAAVDGNDAQIAAGVARYPNPVGGLGMPAGTYTAGSPGVTIHGSPNGSPLYLGSLAQAQDAINIDWNNILNGSSVVPTMTASDCSSLPYLNSSYPIVRINGDCTITGGVEFDGTLIVTGNLTLGHSGGGGGGDPQMRGILLVGRNFNTSGTPQVWGTILSGLNTMIPMMSQPFGPDQMVGNSRYYYDSYEINRAFNTFGIPNQNPVLIVVGNAYEDNVPTY